MCVCVEDLNGGHPDPMPWLKRLWIVLRLVPWIGLLKLLWDVVRALVVAILRQQLGC